MYVYHGETNERLPPTIQNVRISSTVEMIPSGTFESRQGLQEVNFDEATGLKSIGKHAFFQCPLLQVIPSLFPPHLTALESEAFASCTSLMEVDLAASTLLESIGTGVFSKCQLLKKVKLPPNLKTIEKEAFYNCQTLEDIDFASRGRLETIGEDAFFNCRCLTKLKFNPNLRVIEKEAFQECSNLQEIDFGAAAVKNQRLQQHVLLETIHDSAFAQCSLLKNCKIPASVTSFGENVFEECGKLVSLGVSGDNLALAIRLCVLFPQQTKDTIQMERLVHLYSLGPISGSQLLSNKSEESDMLQTIKEAYIEYIITSNRTKPAPVRKQHGWVQFLANHVKNDSEASNRLIAFLRTASQQRVTILANAKDTDGRIARKFAKSHIRKAFEERLLFLGRYDLNLGPPIHKSATCIVIQAEDKKMNEYYEREFDKYASAVGKGNNNNNNSSKKIMTKDDFQKALGDKMILSDDSTVIDNYFSRADIDGNGLISRSEFVKLCVKEFGEQVALKFMRQKDHYQRELMGRSELDLDTLHVVGIIRNHDKTNCPNLVSSLENFLPPYLSNSSEAPTAKQYAQIAVMPFGDRNLDTIFRSERPDMVTVRKQMLDVGKALAHLHERGLVHGDVKMLNVVRINGHLSLVDLDASAVANNKEHIGAKFSSGVLPPEMIHKISNFNEKKRIVEYYKNETPAARSKRAPKFSSGPSKRGYIVRSFMKDELQEVTEDPETGARETVSKDIPRTKALPYSIVKAHPSFDVWSFGVLLYTMCARESLFKVNNEDDITDGNTLRRLFRWNNVDIESVLERHIEDNYARALLRRILRRNPVQRPTMEQVLADDFFHPENHTTISEDVRNELKKTHSLLLANQRMMHDGFSQIHDGLKRVLNYQKAANSLLQEVIEGGKLPKYFVILPVSSNGNEKRGFANFLSKMKKATNPKTYVATKAKVCFICPISLQPVLGKDGEAMGYEINVPRDWVKKYGPAMLIGLKVVQVGLAIGRGLGLPVPSLSGAEEDLTETSDLFAELQALLVEEMECEEDDGLSEVLLSQFTDTIQYGNSNELPLDDLTEDQKLRIHESYKGIATLVEDDSFEECGLVRAYSADGSEFVHPDTAPLYETYGDKCLEMSIEEIEIEKAKLAAKARLQGASTENVKGKVVSESQTMVKEESEKVIQLNGPSPTSTEALLRSLERKVDSIDKKLSDPKPLRDLRDRNIVHRGLLEKQSRRFPWLWQERYFVLRENGSVMYFRNGFEANDRTKGGKSFDSVRWFAAGGHCLQMRSSENSVIAVVRLSKRDASTLDDWLQGDQWIRNQPKEIASDIAKPETTRRHARLNNAGEIIHA